MRQGFMVSRRKLVTFAAGSFVASAVPLTTAIATATPTANVAHSAQAYRLLADSHRHMLESLRRVRRAHGAGGRAQAFAQFTTALRRYDLAELSFGASGMTRGTSTDECVGTLYHRGEPEAVLTRVIVRELEARPKSDPAWLRRFSDLEAVIADKARKRRLDASEPVSLA